MDKRTEKILKKLSELIDEPSTQKAFFEPEYQYFDLWVKRTILFVEKIAPDKKQEYAKLGTPVNVAIVGNESKEQLRIEKIERMKDEAREKQNFLIALKEQIEFFSDKDVSKQSDKIKKYFEIKGKLPGIGHLKWGAKDR